MPTLKLLVISGALAVCGWAAHAEAKTVYLDMDVELDQVAPEDAKMYRVGGHDLDRIAYDDSAVDPATHKTRIPISRISSWAVGCPPHQRKPRP